MEFEAPYKCQKCGKQYGPTSLTMMGCPVYLQCDCGDPNKVYLINMEEAAKYLAKQKQSAE